MNINEYFNIIKTFSGQFPITYNLSELILVLLLSWVAYVITKKYLLHWMSLLVKRSKTTVDDSLLNPTFFRRLALLAPVLILYNFANLFGDFETPARRILTAIIVMIVVLIAGLFLTSLSDVWYRRDKARSLQIKSSLQIVRIILYVLGGVVIVATLAGQSPLVLLSGIGALTAVLLLIFRDTILSFVASLQISSYDLLKVGDWIEVPKYGADGDVMDIALHTIKVQNWDKTITVIPTHKLIEESFKNWRGMQQSGGRRIKRSLNIDMTSIRFCDDKLLADFKKMVLIKNYIETRQLEIDEYNQEKGLSIASGTKASREDPEQELQIKQSRINGRWMTNIGVFRAYLKEYLHNHPKIHNKLTFIVRQLAPGENGLPIEIYVFSNDTDWINYEEVQADIFDHVIAALPWFDLRVFQKPTGHDVAEMRHSL